MIVPIVQMSNIGSQLTEAFAGLDRTEELMNMEAEDDSATRTQTVGPISGDVEFNDVSFAYEGRQGCFKAHQLQSESRKCNSTRWYFRFR